MKSLQPFILLALGISLSIFPSCDKPPPEPNPDNGTSDESANYTVSTFVGGGLNGPDVLTGGPALLYMPGSILFDGQGNLYIADGYNDRIRKVTPAGIMTNFAGSTIGYTDGTGTAAQFNRPTVMTIDAQGNLYVAEAGGLRIRKITPNALVTTFVGNGVAGLVDGTGTAAQIDIPGGMVADAQGNIYFTQTNFHGIRKITPAGVVSTFVGSSTAGFADGTGASAKFNEPYSLVIDAENNIYVSDHKNARIRKVTPAGVVTTVLQRADETKMYNIARDAQGTFYIIQGDFFTTEIVKYSLSGKTTKIAGGTQGYVDGAGNKAQFSYISGQTIDANGNLHVSDLLNGAIRKIRKN